MKESIGVNQLNEYIEQDDDDMKEDMTESIGVTQLIEYIEQDDDGSYCKLMGWPLQTDLSVKPSQPNGATLEAWYPNTTPTAPSELQWVPYKVVKTVPHVSRPGQNHPFRGELRYNRDVGWHYKYPMPLRVTGRPPTSNLIESKNYDGSITSMSLAQLCLWPQPKIKKRAFIKLRRIKVKAKDLALHIGLPELRLRRINQQTGFRSLTKLLK